MKLKNLKNEYNPYYDIYLNLLNSEDEHFEILEKNHNSIFNFFENIEEDKMKYSYQNDKWNIAQILQHLIDTERIFCYRALKIVREDNPNIEAYNHENYANTYKCKSKDILLNDYSNNRKASLSLFKTFNHVDLNKKIDSAPYKFKVGLIPFIFSGHELHHIEVIKKYYLT